MKSNQTLITIIVFGISSLTFSCSTKTDRQTETATVAADQAIPKDLQRVLPKEQRTMEFKSLVDMLRDSTSLYLKLNLAAEQEKIESIRQVLATIDGIAEVNPVLANKLQASLGGMEQHIYSEKTMTDLAQMETYDAMTDSVYGHLIALSVSTPQLNNHVLALANIQNFKKLRSDGFMLRTVYNKYAVQYNTALAQKTLIEKLGAEYTALAPAGYIYGEEMDVSYQDFEEEEAAQ